MGRIMAWVKKHQYKWYRREYLRWFDILSWAIFFVLIATIIPVAITQPEQSIVKAVLAIGFMVLGVLYGILFTLRQVDEHEKKLANKETKKEV